MYTKHFDEFSCWFSGERSLTFGLLVFLCYILDIFVNCFLDILYLFVIMNNYLLHFYHIWAVGLLGAKVTHQM